MQETGALSSQNSWNQKGSATPRFLSLWTCRCRSTADPSQGNSSADSSFVTLVQQRHERWARTIILRNT